MNNKKEAIMRKFIIFLILILFCSIDAKAVPENRGYIYIGDSRTVGLNNDLKLEKDNVFVVAKVGGDYKWFESAAIKQVQKIKKNNKDIEGWVIITNLGVNDLDNSQKYIKKYKKLLKKNWKYDYVYFVSVNPVDKTKYKGYATNAKIKKYNKQLKKIGGCMYINSYSYLIKKRFNAEDGLHYDITTNKKIYKYIKKKLHL